MQLSETGESRLRGYLYVLERSLKASPVARDIAADAVREPAGLVLRLRPDVAGLLLRGVGDPVAGRTRFLLEIGRSGPCGVHHVRPFLSETGGVLRPRRWICMGHARSAVLAHEGSCHPSNGGV